MSTCKCNACYDCRLIREAEVTAIVIDSRTEARIEELEDTLSRLVKENDLAMPNENYQWIYSPMRVECLKVLGNK